MKSRILQILIVLTLILVSNQIFAAWYATSGWLYRKAIAIDYTKVPNTDQVSFPVLVSLSSDPSLNAHARSDGFDILFTSGDGTTKINYQRESYAGGTLVAWVQIPTLSHTANTVIYMYYGNSAATDQQAAPSTWDANYMGVYHLNEATAASNATESTSHVYTGTQANSPATVTAQMAGGRNFNGTSQFIQTAQQLPFGYTGAITYDFWANLPASGGGGNVMGVNCSGGQGYGGLSISLSSLGWTWTPTTTGADHGYSSTISLTANTWAHIVETIDITNRVIHFYVNGTETTAPALFPADGPLANWTPVTSYNSGRVGNFGGRFINSQNYYSGALDELRLSNSVRSADYIRTEYNNESSPSTFYSVGNQEAPTYTWNGGTSTSWQTAANWTPTRTTSAISDILQFSGGVGGSVTNVPTQTIGQLIFSGNTTANFTAASAPNTLTVTDALTTTTNDVLNFGSGVILSGSLTTLTNNGKIQTAVLTATTVTPIPAGKTWGGNVEYNGSGAQTAVAGTYSTLKVNNSTSTGVTLGGASAITTLTIGDVTGSSIFNDGGNTITTASNLTITSGTYNCTASAFPWATASIGGTVNYSLTGSQTVANKSYTNLGISGGSGSVKTLATSTPTTVSGTLTIAASTTLAFSTTAQTLTLSGTGTNTLANSGTIDKSTGPNAAHVLQIAATSIATFGILTTGTGSKVEYTVTGGGQTVNPVTYNHLQLDNTGSSTNTAGNNLIVNGTLTTNSGILDMSTFTLTGTLGTVTNGGTIKTSCASNPPLATGKNWGSSGTIEYALTGGGQFIPNGTFFNLKLDNTTGTITMNGAVTVNGAYSSPGSAGTISTSNNINFNGTTTCGETMSASTGTVTYGSSATNIVAGTYSGLTINGSSVGFCGATTINGTFTPSGILSLSNNLTISGSYSCGSGASINASAGTVEYTVSTGGQNIIAGTYSSLKTDNASGTNNACGNLTVNNTLTTAGGTLEMGSYSLGGTLGTINNGGTIRTAGSIDNGKTWNGIVEYYGAGGQTVAGGTYFNLFTTTAGNFTAGNNISVSSGGLFDNGGGTNVQAVFNMSTYTLNGPGTMNNNNATIRFGGASNGVSGWSSGIIEYFGAASQIIANGNYGCLRLNNSNGATMNGDVNVNGILTDNSPGTPGTLFLTNGILHTNGHTITVSAANSISGGSSSSYIDGILQKNFGTNAGTQSFAFPIGDALIYAPATLDISNVNITSHPVNLTAHIASGDDNESYISGINQTSKANRYWFMNLNSTPGTFSSYDITLDLSNTTNSGVAGGLITGYVIKKFDPSSWASTTGSLVDNTIKATGLTGFSDFEAGEGCNATITLGSNPSVCSGTTTANLTYITTSGSPDKYSIVYDSDAHTAGFTDVTDAGLSSSPIVLAVPGEAAAATYHGTLSVKNTNTDCVSAGYAMGVTVNALPSAGVNGQTNISCFGGSDGTIIIQATGGSGPYMFSVDNGAHYTSGSNPFTYTGLSANIQYQIRVNDTNGCESPHIP